MSRNRTVTGVPAYVIGAVLVGVLPTVFAISFLAGLMMAIRAGGQPNPNDLRPLAGIDAAVSLLAIVAVLTIGFIAGKPTQKTSLPHLGPTTTPPYRPADPNNPYAAPQADDRDRLLDDIR